MLDSLTFHKCHTRDSHRVPCVSCVSSLKFRYLRRSVCASTESASPSRLNTGDAPRHAVRKKLVVASGASRGIGLEFASQLLRQLPRTPMLFGITVWCRLARYCRAAGRISGAACHRVRRDAPRPHHVGHRVKELHADKGGLAAKRPAGLLRCWWQRIHASEACLRSTRMRCRVLATNAIGPVLVSQAPSRRPWRDHWQPFCPRGLHLRTTGWAAGGHCDVEGGAKHGDGQHGA